MNEPVLLDTGPFVAAIDRRERYHHWAAYQLARVQTPFLTCEAVLTEAFFLLRRVRRGPKGALDMLTRGLIRVGFHLDVEMGAVVELLTRYADVPMSLADACLVRMAELYPHGVVLTLDSDFLRYRKNRRQIIPTIMPDNQGRPKP